MTLEAIKAQCNCMWSSTHSQLSSMYKYSRNTVTGFHRSIVFYTHQCALYIFNKDRSSENRNLVLLNFVAPIALAWGVITFAKDYKSGLCVPIAATVYTFWVAWKKGLLKA